jgi:hypothetical protein
MIADSYLKCLCRESFIVYIEVNHKLYCLQNHALVVEKYLINFKRIHKSWKFFSKFSHFECRLSLEHKGIFWYLDGCKEAFGRKSVPLEWLAKVSPYSKSGIFTFCYKFPFPTFEILPFRRQSLLDHIGSWDNTHSHTNG